MHEIPNVLRRICPDFAPLHDAFADNLQTSCPIPIRDAIAKQMVQRLKPSKEKLMFHFFKKASKKKTEACDMKQEYVVRRHSHFDRFDHNPHLTRNTSSLAHLITSFGAHAPHKKKKPKLPRLPKIRRPRDESASWLPQAPGMKKLESCLFLRLCCEPDTGEKNMWYCWWTKSCTTWDV